MTVKTHQKTLKILALALFGLTALLMLQYGQLNGAVYQHWVTTTDKLIPSVRYLFWQGKGKGTNEEQRSETTHKIIEWKTILFWGSWFGVDWSNRFGPHTAEELRDYGCPIWQCHFTSNRSLFPTADAVLVESSQFEGLRMQKWMRQPNQRWIWVNGEAPEVRKPNDMSRERIPWNPSFLINWTMTYHSNADVVAFYGYFRAIKDTQMPLLPNMMSSFPETMKRYKEDIAAGVTLSDVMGPHWQQKLNKTKIVAWMSSHCSTTSRREVYISELSKYVQVDTYGACGRMKCSTRNVFIDRCWNETLRPYSFYMAMENSICSDYITEKLYLPMINYNVPVVWGGANYSRYLPPGSYIDARQYHPEDLANLLVELHNNPVEYSKYHLWRGYWRVYRGGSLCQLCHRLHTDQEPKHYYNIVNWRLKNGMCTRAPDDPFDKTLRPEYWQRFLKEHNSTMV